MKNNFKLSVVILNYNSGKYLAECLQSIDKSQTDFPFEVLVGDNRSTDNSFESASSIKFVNSCITYQFVPLAKNWGFSAGNNRTLARSTKATPYVLFLNPDTTVESDTFQKMVDYFDNDASVDAATCHITLALTQKLQPESHRGFPTPSRAFWHFFGFGLPKLFPKSKIFNGYFLGHLDYSRPVQIEACVGAFLMVKRSVGDAIGWWNEQYFFYGEDLDFCYQLHRLGYKLFFYPYTKITHYQGVSSGLIGHTQRITQAKRETKIKVARASTQAMRIFYRLNLLNKYPKSLHPLINLGINFLEIYRIFKAKYL